MSEHGIQIFPLVCGPLEVYDSRATQGEAHRHSHRSAYRFILGDGEVVDVFYATKVSEQDAIKNFLDEHF